MRNYRGRTDKSMGKDREQRAWKRYLDKIYTEIDPEAEAPRDVRKKHKSRKAPPKPPEDDQ